MSLQKLIIAVLINCLSFYLSVVTVRHKTDISVAADVLGPILLTWINFDPRMDKWSRAQ